MLAVFSGPVGTCQRRLAAVGAWWHGEENSGDGSYASIDREESKMRQISIVLATAVITATVAVAGVLAVNPNPTRPGVVVRTSIPVDVIKMMKDAKDLPEHSYQAF